MKNIEREKLKRAGPDTLLNYLAYTCLVFNFRDSLPFSKDKRMPISKYLSWSEEGKRALKVNSLQSLRVCDCMQYAWSLSLSLRLACALELMLMDAHVIYCCSSQHSIGGDSFIWVYHPRIIHPMYSPSQLLTYPGLIYWSSSYITHVLLIYAPPSIMRDICRDNHRCADRAYVSWASLVEGGSLFRHHRHLYLDAIYLARR